MSSEKNSVKSQTEVVKSQLASSGVAMIGSSISMAVRFAVLIGLILVPALGFSQCAAEANTTFGPFKGGEDKPAGHFESDSSAGPNHDKGGGHPDSAVERHVHNLSTATTLKYSWLIGRMHNDALAQGKTDSYCYEVTWPNQDNGPLNYGRGNDKTDTKVWEGSDEPKENAILAVFSFNIITEEGPRTVSMRFLSSYKTTSQGAFAYEYRFEKLIRAMDEKLQFPGLTNTWTMPVQNRLDMALTGIKTPVGMKLQGTNLEQIQQLGAKVQQILSGLPQVRSVFAERVSQGFYINVEVNRPEAAKYGLTIGDVQQAVESGIGGMNVAENVEGRSRYPINVRYQRDFRDNVGELSRVLIATPSGAQIPISEVAKISFSRGPAMIRDEDGQLTGYIYIDLNTTDYGGFVDQASKMLREKLQLPAGYTYQWSGEYEFQLRAKERMKIILPVVFFVIFLLLYMVFHNLTEAMVLIFPTFYAMTGGLILQWLLGYNFSVAVWVGYIALFGIAVETGVVMVVYLHESLDKRIASGRLLTEADIHEAAIEGAVHRLRPKLMTVSAVLASLIPILWASGIGADVMKPIAAPMVGGMVTSTIHVLILVPVFFVLMKERALRRGTLRPEPAE
jgi:multidrug efflux pump subunit AcrB